MNIEKTLRVMADRPLKEVAATLNVSKQRVSQLYASHKIARRANKAEEIKRLFKPMMTTDQLREVAHATKATYPYVFVLAQRNKVEIKTKLDLAYEGGAVTCLKCGEVKPLDQYYDSKAEARGKSRVCKDCAKASTLFYYRKRREAEGDFKPRGSKYD